jgi:lysophospholipase L1-like esterase
MTTRTAFRKGFTLFAAVGLAGMATQAMASTLTQNVSWTIDRAGVTTKYRITAYGDSIYAGYTGSTTSAAKYAATTVDAEYLSALWNADIENVRRCKSGAVASDIYNNKIVSERSYMQSTNTRVITFEMCGNDGLQARSSFKGQTGTCNYGVLDTALNNCTTYLNNAFNYINANGYSGTKLKAITNLHYPGYNADNVLAGCTDSATGTRPNLRDKFLPYLAKMNYRMCNAANNAGFKCNDQFAQYMGADYDRNGDGQIDSAALAWIPGETESAYVTRITSTLKSTLVDANTHFASSTTSYDYIQSDNTHPTYTGGTVTAGLFGGTTGTGAARYTSFTGGKSPIWQSYGHERMGWGLSTFNPATP